MRRRSWLDGLLAVSPPEPGSTGGSALIELLLLLVVFALAGLTAPFTAVGSANAPLAGLVHQHLGASLCLFRLVTGIDCPGCGLTRSFVQIAHGNLGTAMALHPLAPIVFALFVWRAIQDAVRLAAGRRLELRLPPGWEWRFYGALLAGFAVLGVFRIATHFAG